MKKRSWIKEKSRVMAQIATIALMIALLYEVFLKIGRLLVPVMFEATLVTRIASALSYLAGIIVVVFLLFFQKDQRQIRNLRLFAIALIGCFLCLTALRLALSTGLLEFMLARVLGSGLSVVASGLFLLLAVVWRRDQPDEEKLMRGVTASMAALFGLEWVKNLWIFLSYLQFAFSRQVIVETPILNGIAFLLFLLMHLTIILFLCLYYRLQSK